MLTVAEADVDAVAVELTVEDVVTDELEVAEVDAVVVELVVADAEDVGLWSALTDTDAEDECVGVVEVLCVGMVLGEEELEAVQEG